ncbi:MAG: hypothetical protein KME59_18790, partial [Trichormus sp. ATA11-4-KO1]|nr:hypothetical protein [Trichormus sp. ATA11-4-KO1]
MVTTIAKRIQSKLSRQGLKVSLGEIRPIYKELVKDINKPTDEEISAIFEHFMNNATKLNVISEELEIDTTTTTEEEPEAIASIPQSEEPETAPTGEGLATVDSNVNDVTQLQTIEDDTSTEKSETSICVAARKHKRSGLQTRKLLAHINCKQENCWLTLIANRLIIIC